jgi:hypothetical protein
MSSNVTRSRSGSGSVSLAVACVCFVMQWIDILLSSPDGPGSSPALRRGQGQWWNVLAALSALMCYMSTCDETPEHL